MTPDLFISYVMVLVKRFAGETCGVGGGVIKRIKYESPLTPGSSAALSKSQRVKRVDPPLTLGFSFNLDAFKRV